MPIKFRKTENDDDFILPENPALSIMMTPGTEDDEPHLEITSNMTVLESLVLLHLAQDELLRRIQHNKPPDAHWRPITPKDHGDPI